MATVQELRRRVRAVTNTRKLTKAMELVASARLRRAQERIEAMRPYADRMLELMAGTARASASVRSLPLLQRREVGAAAIVPVTGDRGLAGAFNAQILRRATALYRELQAQGVEVRWLPVGRKGVSTLRSRASSSTGSGGASATTRTTATRRRSRIGSPSCTSNEDVDRVVLVYNHFISPLVQRVTVSDVLPISEDVLETSDEERERDRLVGDFIFEPEPEQILERLLPVYLETEIYRALLESAASEQGARMTAMRNASKSAGELIDNLTLAMNRARQAEITQEILEVVAGADALTA